MIDLKVKPYCQTCPEFQPCSEKLYADGISVATVIRCENAEICNRIEKVRIVWKSPITNTDRQR